MPYIYPYLYLNQGLGALLVNRKPPNWNDVLQYLGESYVADDGTTKLTDLKNGYDVTLGGSSELLFNGVDNRVLAIPITIDSNTDWEIEIDCDILTKKAWDGIIVLTDDVNTLYINGIALTSDRLLMKNSADTTKLLNHPFTGVSLLTLTNNSTTKTLSLTDGTTIVSLPYITDLKPILYMHIGFQGSGVPSYFDGCLKRISFNGVEFLFNNYGGSYIYDQDGNPYLFNGTIDQDTWQRSIYQTPTNRNEGYDLWTHATLDPIYMKIGDTCVETGYTYSKTVQGVTAGLNGSENGLLQPVGVSDLIDLETNNFTTRIWYDAGGTPTEYFPNQITPDYENLHIWFNRMNGDYIDRQLVYASAQSSPIFNSVMDFLNMAQFRLLDSGGETIYDSDGEYLITKDYE